MTTRLTPTDLADKTERLSRMRILTAAIKYDIDHKNLPSQVWKEAMERWARWVTAGDEMAEELKRMEERA